MNYYDFKTTVSFFTAELDAGTLTAVCHSVHILIVDMLPYIDIHLVTLIMSYESVDVHAEFQCWNPGHVIT